MRPARFTRGAMLLLLVSLLCSGQRSAGAADQVGAQSAPAVQPAPALRGVWAVLETQAADAAAAVVDLANRGEVLVYFQSADRATVAAVRQAAAAANLLGTRVFAETGSLESIHLASNLVDRLLVSERAASAVPRAELVRVLRPGAEAIIGRDRVVKPRDPSVDSWSHVYHGPDNNPQSTDQLARAPYRTQFLAAPLFSPMPEVTVAAGGRLFKAFGHIAHKANQNPVLNTLHCINAFNGSLLWERPLSEGFMIHRNTMIATDDQFYLADDQSCKVIAAATGEVLHEIVVPAGLADGRVWKWMALQDGVLYALVGGDEIRVDTVTSRVPGIGHWPWGMWKGHDYSDPRTSFGFGRTLLAVDTRSRTILWHYRDPQYIDSRGVCMRDHRLYFYCPDQYLACLDAHTGTLAWKNSDPALLQAIGPQGRAQHYVTGYATTSYIKCNDRQLFFAGPQRSRFVVAATQDGRLLWQKRQGNVQVVLREEGIYCAGPQLGDDHAGAVYSYEGERLASLPIRRACTRATGSVDGVFYRTSGGTVRVDTSDQSAEHIAPMRPPCQDGVVISDGLLFWGPWMCGCQLSLYGHIALGPAAGAATAAGTPEPQLERHQDDLATVAPLPVAAGDWPTYLRDSSRSGFTRVTVPAAVELAWQAEVVQGALPTAPIVAGGMVFLADRRGAVHALDSTGKRAWRFLTGGPVYYPPTLHEDRLFVGSADGHVYALEAASGRLLWTYRLAPAARRIPVYGSLVSTWPVAGGVVVQDGVVYAAAGIAHYDGTYVAALHAATGAVLWSNDTSGVLSQDVNCGISLQGELQLIDEQLQFLGGGAYQIASYDRRTGRCLNPPRHEVTSKYQTAFYPYYPEYAQYMPLHHRLPDGHTLRYDPTYDGSHPTRLELLAPVADSTPARVAQSGAPAASAKSDKESSQPPRAVRWHTATPQLFNAFIITPDALVSGGAAVAEAQEMELVARSLSDGSIRWRLALAAAPVKAGLAIDGQQRIVVATRDGRVSCFAPAR